MKKGLLLFSLFFAVTISVIAQPGDPGGDPDVPITGIEILITLGGLLGVRKFLRSKSKSDHP